MLPGLPKLLRVFPRGAGGEAFLLDELPMDCRPSPISSAPAGCGLAW